MLKNTASASLLGACLLSGCVAWVVGGGSDKSAVYAKTDVPPFFMVERQLPDMLWGPVRTGADYDERSFKFDSWYESEYKKNAKIEGTFYEPHSPKATDVFIIFPISRGELPSEKFAKILAGLGFYAVSIKSGFKPMPKEILATVNKAATLEAAVGRLSSFFKNAMRQEIVDVMRLMDFLEISLKNKPCAFHAVGMSLGGGIAALLAAVDPRVESLMMMVSSANLANIMLDSNFSALGVVKDIQRLLFGKYGLSYDEAYNALSRSLEEVEPANYIGRLNPDRILLVSGAFDMLGFVDSAIPFSATYKTWKDFGKPEWVTLLFSGHLTSFFAFFPLWFEIQFPHHAVQNLVLDTYAEHLIKDHFLPKALQYKTP